MPKTLQDEFEADYCEHSHRLPALVKNCRLSNGSYGDPCIAKAWHWFKRSREMLVVDLPAVEAWDNDGRLDREKDDTADCAMGLVPVIDVRIAMTAAGITIKATA
ncbi:hypothetical protein C4J88_2975 [Pseudomonas sp. R4-39-08]|uniref:hypothetical protein n=1 Tax=Pseudomonas sp. R4-39-08 TaxID=1173288 RepID=UPI000F56C3CF|nr:hypothetical protein [Pseudomonas sp. R4-39-08]AZF37755.1 hypothetical protein C4J88_2975 [Pseudomonas sp. R4-39-08]